MWLEYIFEGLNQNHCTSTGEALRVSLLTVVHC